MSTTNQRLSLVGAGPGDPELLTLKAVKALKSADAVLYDALVSSEVLSYASPKAVKIPVGKRCGRHSMTQNEINLLIIQSVFRYGHVVRLKGGDPFIYGRGYEELKYARAFGIQVNLIPGISSCTSLPLLQSVPLTSRAYAESFWVLTGTSRHHELSSDMRLAVQSTATLVILMGMRKLRLIAEIFGELNKGYVPAMIILDGATPAEKVILAPITEIDNHLTTEDLNRPGIIVIGKVVSLHPSQIINQVNKTWNI